MKKIKLHKENTISFNRHTKSARLLFEDKDGALTDADGNTYGNEFRVSQKFSDDYIEDDRVDTFEEGVVVKYEDELIYVTIAEAIDHKLDEITVCNECRPVAYWEECHRDDFTYKPLTHEQMKER